MEGDERKTVSKQGGISTGEAKRLPGFLNSVEADGGYSTMCWCGTA